MWARRMVPFLHDFQPKAALDCSLAHGCGGPCFSEKLKGSFTQVQIFPSGCFWRGCARLPCSPTVATAAGRGVLWAACTPPASGAVVRSTLRLGEGRRPSQTTCPSLRDQAALHSEGRVWAPAPLTCGSWRLTFKVPYHHTWWFLIPRCCYTIRLAFGKAPSWAALS